MKKITMLLMFLAATVQSYAQLYEGFEGGTFPPTGWTSFAPANDLGIEESWVSSTTFANTGSRSAFMSYEAADEFVEDWLVTPLTMVPTATPTLTFAQRQQFTAVYNSEYRVMISTTSQTDMASFTAVSTETEVEVPLAFAIKTIDLTAYAGQEIYIAFVMSNQDGDNWYIDDITVGEPPALPEVPGCVSNPTPTDGAVDVPFGAITLSWDAPTTGDAPTAYDLYAGNTADALELLGSYTTTNTADDLVIEAYNATVFWQIRPKNAGGSATGCPVWSFTTEAPPAAPANDACAGAIAATLPYTNTQDDAAGATNNDGFITACLASSSSMNDGVWYSVEGNGLDLTITLSEVGNWDPQMDVYTGSCGDFVCAGSVDDGVAGEGETFTILGSVEGTTYYINVGHYSGTVDNLEGPFTIGIEATEPIPAPENDTCASPTVLTPGAQLETNLIMSTNEAATRDANEVAPSCGASGFATSGKDVWFSVVVPDSGSVTIETTNSQSLEDTVIEVFSGSCGDLTSLDCNDDNPDTEDAFSKVVIEGATAGDVLLVRVWGYSGASGSFNISAYDSSLATASFDNANFKYHPNPVTNVLNLSYTKNISDVAVYNLVGQQVMVKSTNAAQSQIDMSELASGTYIVKVTSGNEVKTIKVIKD